MLGQNILTSIRGGESARTEALVAFADALAIDSQIVITLAHGLARGAVSPLPMAADVGRGLLIFARLLHAGGLAQPAYLQQLIRIAATQAPAEQVKLATLLRAEGISWPASATPAQDINADLHAKKPELRLEIAYKALDWMGARIALFALRPYKYGETLLQRAAETFAACGEFPAALEWAARSTDPARKVKFDTVRARALLGMGDIDQAWQTISQAPLAGSPAVMTMLAASCVRLEKNYDRLALVLHRAVSNTVTIHAVVPILRDIELSDENGRARVLSYLRSAAHTAPADHRVRAIIRNLRFRFSFSGWPQMAEARWAKLLCSLVNTGRLAADEVVYALLAHNRPRAGLSIALQKGLAQVAGQLRILLARALALQGDFGACKRLVAGLAEIPEDIRQFIDHFEPLLAHRADADHPHAALRQLYSAFEACRGCVAENSDDNYPPTLLHIATSLAVGGTERQMQIVIAGLSERHPHLRQVVVLARRGLLGEFENDLAHLGGKLVFLTPEGLDREPVAEIEGIDIADPGLIARKAVRWARVHRLALLIARSRACAVMMWRLDASALIAAKLAGVKAIVARAGSLPAVCRSDHTELQIADAGMFAAAIHATAHDGAVRLVANSQASLDAFRTHAHWPWECSSRLYNVLSVERFQTGIIRQEARALLDLPEGVLIIGGVFRLSPEKRPVLWLDVARAIALRQSDRELLFVLAGDGPLLSRLRERVARDEILAPRVRFLGKVEAQIAYVYSAFDLLLHTSSVEGLPNVLIEAQAAHCPVVSVDVGGCREAILPGQTGLVCYKEDVTSIATQLEKALSMMPDLHSQSTGQCCDRFLAEHFSAESNLRQLEGLLGFHQSQPKALSD